MTSYSGIRRLLALVAIAACAGCSAVRSPGPPGASPDPALSRTPLAVEVPVADRISPQVARTVPILWRTSGTGWVGVPVYSFILSDGLKETEVQRGYSTVWEWLPREGGRYRVKSVIMDSLWNRAESPWSDWFEIAPPLAAGVPVPDRKSPQAAGTAPVVWRAFGSGGTGSLSYTFILSDGVKESEVQKGASPGWEWRPAAGGRYRVRSVVTDSMGNRAESPWSSLYEVAQPLAVAAPVADRKSPQAARTVSILWRTSGSGGVGPPTYAFVLYDGEKETEVRRGPSSDWEWRPEAGGRYRVKSVMTDSLGNRAESPWSALYEVALPLAVAAPVADRKSPQAAKTGPILWRTSGSGGIGPPTYAFVLSDGVKESEVRKGASPGWEWRPQAGGRYRMKTVMTDTLGNRIESPWSEWYEVEQSIGRDARIAVFPVMNISGAAAPAKELSREIRNRLAAKGLKVLDDSSLDAFMTRHRIRYTGGLTRDLAGAFRSELSVDAVLIASLDTYEPADPPKFGMTARLASTADETAILWIDGLSLSGDQSPGFLNLGLVTDPKVLMSRAVERIARSIDGYLSGRPAGTRGGGARRDGDGSGHKAKFRPMGLFIQPGIRDLPLHAPIRLAVLPFIDRSGRPNAGEVMAQKFLLGLAGRPGVQVVEPGVVRQALLQSRLIMEGGLSLPQGDILRDLLGVEYVITGELMDYQDAKGHGAVPYAEFSVYVIDTRIRQIVWMSSSYERGDAGVYLFDLGKTHTAADLVSEMALAVSELFLRGEGAPE